jgi:two-component system NarL family sensor kinase
MNVVRHARARTCMVQMGTCDGHLRVEIADDGVGFADGRGGIGLRSMRERAAELGGTLQVESRPSGGTRVVVQLPIL